MSASSPDGGVPATADGVADDHVADHTDDTAAAVGDFDDIPAAFATVDVEWSRLQTPAVIRVLLGLIIAVAVVIWPDRTDSVLVVLVAALLVAFSLQVLSSSLRRGSRDPISIITAAAGFVVAVLLFLDPDRTITFVGRVAAAAIAVFAIADLVGALRRNRREQGPLLWPAAKFLALVSIALSLAAYPRQLLAIITVAVAGVWAAISALTIVRALTLPAGEEWDRSSTRHLVLEWLLERPKTADDRRLLYSKILYEGPQLSRRLARYFTLMTFAAIISTTGVLNDSTAIVIGAMLIAPLMTPLMGIAISVVMGWPHRLARSFAIALGGVLLTIVISYLLTRVAPASFDVLTNSQVVSRATPTTIDLITATAAGAAGAYGLSRPDVSDALPGVAIAISLVPPLSVIGIAYAEQDWEAGNGALLLFTTNALAIVVVGGLTFVFTGVTPIRQVAENQHRVRTASASVVVLTGIVVGGLVLNGAELAANEFKAGTVRSVAEEWADEDDRYDLVETRVDGNVVTVVVVGPPGLERTEGRPGVRFVPPPNADELDALLEEALDSEVVTDLRVVLQQQNVVGD